MVYATSLIFLPIPSTLAFLFLPSRRLVLPLRLWSNAPSTVVSPVMGYWKLCTGSGCPAMNNSFRDA